MEDEIKELRNVVQTLEQELSNEREKSRMLEVRINEVWHLDPNSLTLDSQKENNQILLVSKLKNKN